MVVVVVFPTRGAMDSCEKACEVLVGETLPLPPSAKSSGSRVSTRKLALFNEEISLGVSIPPL